MDCLIRKVQQGDELDLAYIQTESWKAAFKDILPTEILQTSTDLNRATAMYKQLLDENVGNGYILEADSHPHCIAWWDMARDSDMPDYAELICIHSLQDNWRKGFGTQMMSRVMANEVVGVHEQDVGAAGKLKAMVASGRDAGVCLVDGFDARIGLGCLVNHGGGVVGRAVVDADDLDVAQRLLQKAVQAFLEVPLGVVDGYDDRYGGAGCHRALLLANNG